MAKNILLVFNRTPYDGTDVTWNGLRLAEHLIKTNSRVQIFLMNDSVDLARETTKPPGDYFDLVQMLKDLIAQGVRVKVCGTCKARCGIHKGEPYYQDAEEATMSDLAQWVIQADKIITF